MTNLTDLLAKDGLLTYKENMQEILLTLIKLQHVNEYVAAWLLGIAVQTLRNRRTKGEPPDYFKDGKRVMYRIGDLLHYKEGQRVKTGRQ